MHYFGSRAILTIFSLAFVFLSSSPIPAKAGYILDKDWEDSVTWPIGGAFAMGTCCNDGDTQTIVTSPVRAGTKAVKIVVDSTVLKTDPRVRCCDGGIKYAWNGEQIIRSIFYRTSVGPKYGAERWYGFSVYIDPSWTDPSTDRNGTVVFALHAATDAGEAAKSGHFAIEITRDSAGPFWEIRSIYDASAITTHSPKSFTARNWNVGPLDKGVWVDWVVYGKWSYRSDGILKVWKNGVLVINDAGPNTYNDQRDQFAELGIYKSWWHRGAPTIEAAKRLTAYFDEYRIGDQNSSYNEVAPRGSPSSTLTAPANLTITGK